MSDEAEPLSEIKNLILVEKNKIKTILWLVSVMEIFFVVGIIERVFYF